MCVYVRVCVCVSVCACMYKFMDVTGGHIMCVHTSTKYIGTYNQFKNS